MSYKKIIYTIISVFLINNTNALKIEIKQGEVKPEPIIIDDLNSTDGKKISEIIKKDLELSSLFIIVSIADRKLDTTNLKDLQSKGARFLLYGQIIDNNQIKFTLVDVITGKKLYKDKIVNINHSNIRETAHIIADYVYERITNELGSNFSLKYFEKLFMNVVVNNGVECLCISDKTYWKKIRFGFQLLCDILSTILIISS